ncbi:threonine/serine exporter family protein [Fructobacillus sp. CRL 2054]|uniref:threonine/serine ThrE exporter family protein n=1 Tax=Fructobacillus sp. CRL 2054 TaxID=2763007 RepID=UPI0023783636|nr:threonine/serine exporter family protein [Fructobacillus sp. CRL 2054]MDD9139246.1 threonine/serine exporter family protein [Fructobacillus sp. CRL 2054]
MTSSTTKSALNDTIHPEHLRQHMAVRWEKFIGEEKVPARESTLPVRASIVGRVGILLLSCGTGAWRVRSAMNTVARALQLTVSADIGFTAITFSCFDGVESYTESLTLAATGVNTHKMTMIENFVADFASEYADQTPQIVHKALSKIQKQPGNYSALMAGLAAAIACAGFIFLLGGGPVEMLGCFTGAFAGNFTRKVLGGRHWNAVATTGLGVAAACLTYVATLFILGLFVHLSSAHEAGYIGSMLFVIPGFPFITSILDLSKNDMRSGLERLAFALMIIFSATLIGWLLALVFQLHPQNFLPQGLSLYPLIACRLMASFAGVFGFSMMFNSKPKMAITAGLIGAVANTTRLELVDLSQLPPAAAAFVGALIAGVAASLINHRTDFPRISLTVPAIVIMVPGLYIYRGVYNLGLNNIGTGATWLVRAALIMVFLPFGLYVARFLFDKDWRKVD